MLRKWEYDKLGHGGNHRIPFMDHKHHIDKLAVSETSGNHGIPFVELKNIVDELEVSETMLMWES